MEEVNITQKGLNDFYKCKINFLLLVVGHLIRISQWPHREWIFFRLKSGPIRSDWQCITVGTLKGYVKQTQPLYWSSRYILSLHRECMHIDQLSTLVERTFIWTMKNSFLCGLYRILLLGESRSAKMRHQFPLALFTWTMSIPST